MKCKGKEAHLLWCVQPQISLSKSASLIFERGPFSSLVSLVKVQIWRYSAESLFGVLGLVLVMIRLGRNLSHCNQALYATQLALAWNYDMIYKLIWIWAYIWGWFVLGCPKDGKKDRRSQVQWLVGSNLWKGRTKGDQMVILEEANLSSFTNQRTHFSSGFHHCNFE